MNNRKLNNTDTHKNALALNTNQEKSLKNKINI